MSKIVMGYYRSSNKLQKSMVQFLHYPNSSLLFSSRNITTLSERNYYFPKPKFERYGYSMQYQGLQLFSTNRQTWTTFGSTNMVIKDGKEKIEPPVPDSRWPRLPYWARWLLGSILTVIPFSNDKWAKLQTIEGKAEMVVDEVENVVEIIEETAKIAEKVSSDVADLLPENGKLKQTALFVERLSKQASQEAQLAIDFIHKIDELKDDLEDLETMVEPVVVKKTENESEGK